MKLREQEAKIQVAKWESEAPRVKRPPVDARPPTRDLRNLVTRAFSEALEQKGSARPKAELDQAFQALKETWRQAEARRIEFLAAVASREALYGFSWADRTPPRFHFDGLDFAVLGWAVFAFGVSGLLAIHELRRSLRRNARARLPGGIALGFVVGAIALGGCQGPHPRGTESTQKAAEEKLARATADAAEQQTLVERGHLELIKAWSELLGDTPEQRKKAQKEDSEFLGRVRALAEQAALEDLLAADVVEIAGLGAEEQKLNELTRLAQWRLRAFAAVKVAGIVILGFLVIAPFRLARRRISAQQKADAQTCPRCLAVGQLAVLKTPRARGDYTESTFLECQAIVSEPTFEEPEGKKCGYRIARSHRYVPRLCFPTVGIRASGKTHMLTTAYSAIQNRMTPSLAAVQTAPSVMDERFREYIKLILRDRGVTGPTPHDTFIDPLLIHTRDTDRWGPNGVLVNLFDYSGELVEDNPLNQMLYPRVMLMDGFMMFFDPTQIYGEGTDVTLEEQIQALSNFYQQMAEARGLPPGTVIPNPVAVCITKFDLLESHNPIGGQCLPFIQHLDGPLKLEQKQPVTLEILKARSDLVEQMLPLMFPGVDLGRLVREYFGAQMLFFPMSSVNLNVDEFGRIDTSSRNPAPYGVVEPILWLMHMHGYCVLDKQ